MHTASLHEHQSSIDTVILYGTCDSCKKIYISIETAPHLCRAKLQVFPPLPATDQAKISAES